MLQELQDRLSQKLSGRRAESFFSPFMKRPFSSLASLAALGAGVSLLLSGKVRPRQNFSAEEEWSQAAESSYFDAAPRSLSGSHQRFADYSEAPRLPVTTASLLIGSAAALTAIYLFGRRR